ncbi:MAG: hypothetical protein KDH94_06735, partial [Coxiellaceae bacterium]|nr:hypothetical protein [Coxiellaceae bacterium]
MNILRKAWHRFWIKRWPSAYHSETLTRISAEDTDIANLTLKTVRARLSEKQVNTLIQHCDLPNADVISLFHSVTDKVPFLIALSDQSLHLLLNDSDTIQDLPLDDIVIALSTRTQKFINDVWKKLGNFFRGKNGVITCHNTQHNDIIKRVLLVGGVETLSFWAKSYPRHKLLKDQFVQERVTDVLIDQEHFFYEMLKSDALPSISSLTLQKILETHYSNGVPKPVIETLIAMAKANADHARV